MATRSLTEVYILMRNNSIHSRHAVTEHYNDHLNDDRVALVSKRPSRNIDPELGIGSPVRRKLPPEWVDVMEEVRYDISKISAKMKELNQMHDKHMNRPTFDDSVEEEQRIEILTREITDMFHQSQRSIELIGRKSRSRTGQETRLSDNVMRSLATTLQDLSGEFRRDQSSCLKRLRSREEGSSRYFNNDSSGAIMFEDNYGDEDVVYDRGFNESQMQAVKENTVAIEEREKEVQNIVQSIMDLNQIFRDLANLVVDQGTVLDRIDYNLEKTNVSVSSGLKQLQKAEKYQKKNRKMMCIMVLALVVVVLIIILFATKFR